LGAGTPGRIIFRLLFASSEYRSVAGTCQAASAYN
jgi:hypothetical protein